MFLLPWLPLKWPSHKSTPSVLPLRWNSLGRATLVRLQVNHVFILLNAYLTSHLSSSQALRSRLVDFLHTVSFPEAPVLSLRERATLKLLKLVHWLNKRGSNLEAHPPVATAVKLETILVTQVPITFRLELHRAHNNFFLP